MSAKTRADLAKMRQKYAHTFKIDIETVHTEAWQDDGEGRVWCPTKPELPTWTLNQSEEDYFAPRQSDTKAHSSS